MALNDGPPLEKPLASSGRLTPKGDEGRGRRVSRPISLSPLGGSQTRGRESGKPLTANGIDRRRWADHILAFSLSLCLTYRMQDE